MGSSLNGAYHGVHTPFLNFLCQSASTSLTSVCSSMYVYAWSPHLPCVDFIPSVGISRAAPHACLSKSSSTSPAFAFLLCNFRVWETRRSFQGQRTRQRSGKTLFT